VEQLLILIIMFHVKHYSSILFTLFKCLPPSNSVVRKTEIISLAISKEINLAGKATIFALLCSRANFAISGIQDKADLTFLCLLAVIFTPVPEPQIKIPN